MEIGYEAQGEGGFVGLHQNGLFSVNSMYRALLGVEAPYNILIWKLKLPLKI